MLSIPPSPLLCLFLLPLRLLKAGSETGKPGEGHLSYVRLPDLNHEAPCAVVLQERHLRDHGRSGGSRWGREEPKQRDDPRQHAQGHSSLSLEGKQECKLCQNSALSSADANLCPSRALVRFTGGALPALGTQWTCGSSSQK